LEVAASSGGSSKLWRCFEELLVSNSTCFASTSRFKVPSLNKFLTIEPSVAATTPMSRDSLNCSRLWLLSLNLRSLAVCMRRNRSTQTRHANASPNLHTLSNNLQTQACPSPDSTPNLVFQYLACWNVNSAPPTSCTKRSSSPPRSTLRRTGLTCRVCPTLPYRAAACKTAVTRPLEEDENRNLTLALSR